VVPHAEVRAGPSSSWEERPPSTARGSGPAARAAPPQPSSRPTPPLGPRRPGMSRRRGSRPGIRAATVEGGGQMRGRVGLGFWTIYIGLAKVGRWAGGTTKHKFRLGLPLIIGSPMLSIVYLYIYIYIKLKSFVDVTACMWFY